MSETISLGALRFAAHSRVSDPRWLTVTVDAGNYEDQFSLRLEDWLSLKLAADVIAAADKTISDLREQLASEKNEVKRLTGAGFAAMNPVTVAGIVEQLAAATKERDDLRTQLSEALLKCDVLRAELDRAAVEIAKLRRES